MRPDEVNKKRRHQKTINRLRPLSDRRVDGALEQVTFTPMEDQDWVALGLVTNRGTATILTERVMIAKLGAALIEAAQKEFVGVQIDM